MQSTFVRKRIIILAFGCLLLIVGFSYGLIAGEHKLPPYDTVMRLYKNIRDVQTPGDSSQGNTRESVARQGRWRRTPSIAGASDALTPEQKAEVNRLASLGYVSGVKPAQGVGGITIYDEDLAFDGMNLVVSGHGPEAVMLDMRGTVLHSWTYGFSKAFPESRVRRHREHVQFWRRARLLENGDLLAIFEGHGLIRIDKDSNLVWAFPGRAHHDLDISADGLIYVLTRKIKFIPRINEKLPILEDFVSVLDMSGNLVREYA
jgi:hypothetical protein